MYIIFVLLVILQLVSVNNADNQQIKVWFEKALEQNKIQLNDKEKQEFVSHLSSVISLRREYEKKHKLELALKRERMRKQKFEKEQQIYRKYLASRIKGSILNDFHTIRY